VFFSLQKGKIGENGNMKRHLLGLLILGMVLPLSILHAEQDAKLSIEKKGVGIDAGKMGTFVLQAPLFMLDADQGLKPEFKASGDKGEAVYSNGARFLFEVKKDEIICSFEDMPKDGPGSFKFIMDIPISFNKGGKYSLGSKEFKEFPAEIKTEQFIVTGDNSDFSFSDPDGHGLTLELRSNWFGLQDNRVWNTQSFSYQFLVDPKAMSAKELKIKVKTFRQ
jgi:hypothetical protein